MLAKEKESLYKNNQIKGNMHLTGWMFVVKIDDQKYIVDKKVYIDM